MNDVYPIVEKASKIVFDMILNNISPSEEDIKRISFIIQYNTHLYGLVVYCERFREDILENKLGLEEKAVNEVIRKFDEYLGRTLSNIKDEAPNTNRCPLCGKPCRYRHGVYFDHQKICHECNVVWDPMKIDEWKDIIDQHDKEKV